MIYAILIHGSEAEVAAMPPDAYDALMARHAQVRRDLTAQGRLGPVFRLEPEVPGAPRRYKDRRFVTDGPFAETKEQLMGIYVVDCATLEDAARVADGLAFETGLFEIRPLVTFEPGQLAADPAV